MAEYKLTRQAQEDLIRIHQYGIKTFGESQADKYFDAFFDKFEVIAARPQSFEAVDYIKPGYRRCVCGIDSIFFRVNNGVTEIITIIGKQDIEQIIR